MDRVYHIEGPALQTVMEKHVWTKDNFEKKLNESNGLNALKPNQLLLKSVFINQINKTQTD